MQHKSVVKRITLKELTLFFASPLAYIFLLAFVGLCLFAVFWGETFFARNIADVRPLFEWMPVILIFLCAALTMRMWSEEKRTGTLEFVITVPTPGWQFVLAKFLACMVLLSIALLLTLVLPFSVNLVANLDWGPVFSAYLATLLLGSAYIAIGLFISSRSDNQIVSLMLTTIVCGIFYFIGSQLLVGLFNHTTADFLRLLGTGSRFESITRGVIDVRDLYYYLSLTATFLVLNVYTLEKYRWAKQGDVKYHHSWYAVIVLLIINLIAVNLWLQPATKLRLDMTEGDIYSISDATDGYLEQLQEPLLIRGYFSEKTHPLLAPLVPQLRDLLKEYEVNGNGKVRTEFIDPMQYPELEEEASSKFGIQPVPFQMADRYQSSVVNSYFDIVVQYGDQFEKLGFRDLIEVKSNAGSDIEVKLRNPEYDITRSIKKVLYSYQSGGNIFDSIKRPLKFTAYVSKDALLPESLVVLKNEMQTVLGDIAQDSGNKFNFEFVEPEANGGAVAREIGEQFGFTPMAASLLSTNRFYFYMVMNDSQLAVQVPLPEQYTGESFRQLVNSGLKRFASGFMKNIGFVAAENQYTGKQYNTLRSALSENYTVTDVDLLNGIVPGDIDTLAVISPDNLTEKQLFAIDQYLMQGGTVVMATSPFSISLTNTEFSASESSTGVSEWLDHYGLNIEKSFVMDNQNAPFPVPVKRKVGPITVQEMQMLDYPFFVDVREAGLDADNIMTSGLQQVTMSWASPIIVDETKNHSRKVEKLVFSSDKSWTTSDTDILPRANGHFVQGSDFKPSLLGVAVSGEFSSYFADKESPLLAEENTDVEENNTEPETKEMISSVIKKSAESAKIILFSSNEFLNDQTLQIAGMAGGIQYINPVQLIANAVEWSLEDTGLLSIRSRSNFSRTLPPIESDKQIMIEISNYIFALIGVFIIYLVQRVFKSARHKKYAQLLVQGVSL